MGQSSISAARWMVAVMASVVLAFLIATFAGQALEAAVASRAHDITANAMPSVEHLSTARGALHRLERDLERRDPTNPETQSDADAARQDAEVALADYATLSFFPGEQALYLRVTDAMHALDRDRARYDAAPAPEQLATLRRDFAAVDRGLERVITFDAVQSQRLGLEIERMRGESRDAVALLDALSVALASCAVVLALRQLRRVARQRELERSAAMQREAALAEKTESLGQFAGRVAHDVLSPLSSVTLALDLLRDDAADRAGVRTLERAMSGVHRVQHLVDGLLVFARAGGHPEPGVATELAPALADLADGLAAQADVQHITLALAPVPAGWVACSDGVFASLVGNLVRNAIKYMGAARERRIDVRVTDAGARWRVEVSDTGPGIAADQRSRIFEPYVQIVRGGGGIGLGLATVDRLSRAHGGACGVHSELGVGSAFWFELPKVTDATARRGTSA